MLRRIILFVLVASIWGCKSSRNEQTIPVDDFFKTFDKAYYHISPDGKSLSYLKLQDRKLDLFVEDLATGNSVQLTHLTEKQ
ncbi:TolB-like translocation protein [Pedobacter agri]|uniref:hypothetical protein n=1 Tax=Pedobacter agri TaxID=454586 RepID=UPI001EE646DD|nr:hypothetical protein [Pedobacter agri]